MHMRISRIISGRAARMLIFPAVLAATASLILSPGVANASATSCAYGPGDNVYTCMSVNGSSNYINFEVASASPELQAETLDVIIIYQPTNTALAATGFKHVAAGSEIDVYWSPNADEPTGKYCAYTYQNSLSDRLSYVCVDVVI
jgi:hypothetical protein